MILKKIFVQYYLLQVSSNKSNPFCNRKDIFFCKMTRADKFVYVQRFAGEPKLSDFKIISEELPELEDNGKFKSESIKKNRTINFDFILKMCW